MKSFHSELMENLDRAIVKIDSTEECRSFFEDVCTVKELQDIAQRLKVAEMLDAGSSYQEVSHATGASTATISRVNKCLVYGSGGYESIIRKLDADAEAGSEAGRAE